MVFKRIRVFRILRCLKEFVTLEVFVEVYMKFDWFTEVYKIWVASKVCIVLKRNYGG